MNPHKVSLCHYCYVRIVTKCHYSAFLQVVTKLAGPKEPRFIVFEGTSRVSIKSMDKDNASYDYQSSVNV
jgi:hypothetical protein